MHQLARVLLDVDALDADALVLRDAGLLVGVDGQRTFAHQRMIKLGNLVALRQVGIEVVLAVEPAPRVDLGLDRHARAHRLADAFLVGHRQPARHCRVDQAPWGPSPAPAPVRPSASSVASTPAGSSTAAGPELWAAGLVQRRRARAPRPAAAGRGWAGSPRTGGSCRSRTTACRARPAARVCSPLLIAPPSRANTSTAAPNSRSSGRMVLPGERQPRHQRNRRDGHGEAQRRSACRLGDSASRRCERHSRRPPPRKPITPRCIRTAEADVVPAAEHRPPPRPRPAPPRSPAPRAPRPNSSRGGRRRARPRPPPPSSPARRSCRRARRSASSMQHRRATRSERVVRLVEVRDGTRGTRARAKAATSADVQRIDPRPSRIARNLPRG